MVRLNRRRVRTRRFIRPAKSQPPPPLAPIEIDSGGSGTSTEFTVDAVPAAPPHGQQESTVELKAILPQPQADPNEETAEAITAGAPEPPKRMEFTCPCGASLIATAEIYDKHTRCAMCQTVMLANLVYDAETRTHEIVAFRVNPESGA